MNIIIGKRGFISTEIKKLITKKEETIFLSPENIESFKIGPDHSYKIILLSFDRKWFRQKDYDCENEIKILKKFGKTQHTLIYASTSKIYKNGISLNEKSLIAPQSTYAENKLVAENFIRKNFDAYNIFRMSNVFSETNIADGSFLDSVTRNLEKNKVCFDVCKSSLRDFIHIKNVSKALFSRHALPTGIYNLSSNVGLRIDEIINSIILGNDIDHKNLTFSYGTDIRSQTLSNKKISDILKFNKISRTEILNKMSMIKC